MNPPEIGPVLETALYVSDLRRSVEFYRRVLGLRVASDHAPRMCALALTAGQVLLLFRKGGSVRPTAAAGGTIPPTDGDGELHLALYMHPSDHDAWERHLAACGVEIESTVTWSNGGRSLYFRDPDRHTIELKSSDWYGRALPSG